MSMDVQAHRGLQQLPSLAPSLRCALEILQMPLAQLQRYVEEQVEENPLLELADQSSTPGASTSVPAEREDPEEFYSDPVSSNQHSSKEEGYNDSLSYDSSQRTVSLHEHLLFQLHCLPSDPQYLNAAEILVEWLDSDGYLRALFEEIAQAEGLTTAVLEQGLALIQRLDPSGVGARSLPESLLIQLAHRNQSESLAARIIRSHFETFTKRRLNELISRLHADPSKVRAACEVIAHLDPKPARNFSADPALPLVPDLIVRKVDGEYEVELNHEVLPRVTLNRRYRTLMRDPAAPADARQFLRERLRQALWLLKALEQRRARLLGIGRCLIELQRDYFEHGGSHLRSLTQDEVASAVGCHPSTISRGIAHKTIQTPYGIVPLERFFGGGLTDGQHPSNRISTHVIRAELKQLIASEDHTRPLSDEAIGESLRARGYPVARRTVAKYREQLNILPAHLRRQLPGS